MVVVLIPAKVFDSVLSSSFIIGSVPLTHAEQIVKTSGNLFASFLIQGGGFKFYQGEGQSSENYIIKAKLIGNLRFHWKNLLEHYRENGLIIFIFASSFGFDSGFIINSLEVNIQNRERGLFNCTISLQRVQESALIPKLVQGLLLSALDVFADINLNIGTLFGRKFTGLSSFNNPFFSNTLSFRLSSYLSLTNDSYKKKLYSNLPIISEGDDSDLYYQQVPDESEEDRTELYYEQVDVNGNLLLPSLLSFGNIDEVIGIDQL